MTRVESHELPTFGDPYCDSYDFIKKHYPECDVSAMGKIIRITHLNTLRSVTIERRGWFYYIIRYDGMSVCYGRTPPERWCFTSWGITRMITNHLALPSSGELNLRLAEIKRGRV